MPVTACGFAEQFFDFCLSDLFPSRPLVPFLEREGFLLYTTDATMQLILEFFWR